MIADKMKALVKNSSAIRAMFEEGKIMYCNAEAGSPNRPWNGPAGPRRANPGCPGPRRKTPRTWTPRARY